MTMINVTPDSLQIRFSRGEKLAGLIRDLDVPREQIRRVTLVPEGLAAVRGIRAPGLGLPGVRKLGTWRSRGSKTLVAVRSGQPAVQVDIEGGRFDRLLLGHDEAQRYVDQLAG